MPPRPDRSDGVRPGGVSRLRAIDPLVPVVAGVSLVVYVLHGFHGMLTRDLGIYSYAGQQVADGVPPYLGVLNRAGPLAHVLPGVGVLVARLGGLDDVITMRVIFMLMATAAVCVSYLLGRDLFRSRGAGLVTASAMLAVHGFIQYASNGPREKTPMTLFVIGALWAVTHRRWFTAGVLTSLATLCLQTAFFSTFTAVAVGALLLATGGRIRALVRIAVGGLVPVAVLGTWFALAGSLGAAWDGFYAINRRYTVPNPLDAERELVWDDLQVAYGVTVWLLLAGAVLLVLVSLAAVSRRARAAVPGLAVLPAMTAGLLAGLAWIREEYDAWADLFPVLPFAAIGLGAGFAVATHGLARRPPGRRGGGARRRRRRRRADVLALDPGRLPAGPARGHGRGAGDPARRRHHHVDRGAAAAGADRPDQPDALPDVPQRAAGLHGGHLARWARRVQARPRRRRARPGRGGGDGLASLARVDPARLRVRRQRAAVGLVRPRVAG